MTDKKIRLLITEDSGYMLMALRSMIKLDPGIEIVGEAKNGLEGAEMAAALRPDIITMDVNMPGLNGIDATRRIMKEAPTAIVMLSSMTERGRAATNEALLAGAVDFMPKTMSAVDIDLRTISRQVAEKIRFWGHNGGFSAADRLSAPPIAEQTDLLVLAGGTGSPLAISSMLGGMPVGAFPILVSLDTLSPAMTAAYVEHLTRSMAWPVRQATHRGRLSPGTVYLVPGGRSALLEGGEGLSVALRPEAEDALVASIVATARCPTFVFFSGKPRIVSGLTASGDMQVRVYVQPPESCALPTLVQAVQSAAPSSIVLAPLANGSDPAIRAA